MHLSVKLFLLEFIVFACYSYYIYCICGAVWCAVWCHCCGIALCCVLRYGALLCCVWVNHETQVRHNRLASTAVEHRLGLPLKLPRHFCWLIRGVYCHLFSPWSGSMISSCSSSEQGSPFPASVVIGCAAANSMMHWRQRDIAFSEDTCRLDTLYY